MHLLKSTRASLHSACEKFGELSVAALVTPPKFSNQNFLKILQRMWNKLMHAYIGNPVILKLEELLYKAPAQPVSNDSYSQSMEVIHPPFYTASNPAGEDFFHSQLKLSRIFLMQHRSPSKGPPIICTTPAPRLQRTGRRHTRFTPQGEKQFYSQVNSRIKSKNSRPNANKPAPPQRGAPGTTQVVNEESKPFDPPHSFPLRLGLPVQENETAIL